MGTPKKLASMAIIVAICLFFSASSALGAIVSGMKPYLQGVTTTSVFVLLECTTTGTVTVEYGPTASYGFSATTTSTTATNASPATYVHNVKLTGLSPGTLYHYRAGQGGAWSADATFTTAPNPGASFRFAFMSDCRTQTGIHNTVAGRVLGYNPKLALIAGDLCETAAYTAWKNQFFVANELALINKTPWVNGVGNHETASGNTRAFTHGPNGDEVYFSFDYGDIHFVVLNTQDESTTTGLGVGGTQYNWLNNDLAATTKPWKIVLFHKSAYVAGGHGENATMKAVAQNIFVPRGVQLCITGHSHFYQRNLVSGIHHLQIGTYGAPLDTAGSAGYVQKTVRDYAFGIADATPTTLHIEVFEDGGTKIDAIDLSIGPPPTPTPSPTPTPTPTPTPVTPTPSPTTTPGIGVVDISAYYNQDGFSYDSNRTDGAYEEAATNSCYAAELIDSYPTFESTSYQLGPMRDGANNCVKGTGQTIAIPQAQYTSIRFLASATNAGALGGQITGTFRLNYADGTFTDTNVTVKGWCATNTTGHKIVQTMTHKHLGSADQTINNYIFAYYLTPTAGKTVTGLVLPNNADIHVLALSVVGAAPPPTPTPSPTPTPTVTPTPSPTPVQAIVDLSAFYNQDGFSYDTDRTNGAYEVASPNSCYAAELINTNPTFESATYQLGPKTDGAMNAVYGTGQTIALPQGQYSSVRFLASATNAGAFGGQLTGTFRINYSDSTYTNVNVTVKGWCATNTSGQKIVQTMAHKHLGDTDQTINNYVFAYYLTPTAGKTVTGLVLPNNADIHVLAITLMPQD